ncbi:hypothetical protein ACGF5F_17215 [Streptomyces sp. NPDC047821]|uniref:hypothetical protein n=1 Tax=unclassified Streptomyces TaxID=2593676 RepID=UPI00363A1E37
MGKADCQDPDHPDDHDDHDDADDPDDPDDRMTPTPRTTPMTCNDVEPEENEP